MPPDAPPSPPFVIWTLRRTGGTALAQHLFQASPHRATEHEPFNPTRIWGDVAAAFDRDGDAAALEEICDARWLIKHCVEHVPEALNRALMACATARGYRHLFLIRAEPGDRLLSLHAARASGVWGKRARAERSDAELALILRKTPIDTDDLLTRERADRVRLRALFDQAQSLGVRPLIATFEDLYDYARPSLSLARLARLQSALGLDADDAAGRRVLFGGGQRTRDIYRLIPGHDAFRRAATGLGPMTLGPPPDPAPPHWAEFARHPGCRIDPPRPSWRSDLVQVTGTAPPADGWRMELPDGTILPMETGLPGAEGAAAGFAVLDLPRAGQPVARMVAGQSSSGPSQ